MATIEKEEAMNSSGARTAKGAIIAIDIRLIREQIETVKQVYNSDWNQKFVENKLNDVESRLSHIWEIVQAMELEQ